MAKMALAGITANLILSAIDITGQWTARVQSLASLADQILMPRGSTKLRTSPSFLADQNLGKSRTNIEEDKVQALIE